MLDWKTERMVWSLPHHIRRSPAAVWYIAYSEAMNWLKAEPIETCSAVCFDALIDTFQFLATWPVSSISTPLDSSSMVPVGTEPWISPLLPLLTPQMKSAGFQLAMALFQSPAFALVTLRG